MEEQLLDAVLTCPVCGFQATEIMLFDACLFFYECTSCQSLLKPKKGDCCVFCSYENARPNNLIVAADF